MWSHALFAEHAKQPGLVWIDFSPSQSNKLETLFTGKAQTHNIDLSSGENVAFDQRDIDAMTKSLTDNSSVYLRRRVKITQGPLCRFWSNDEFHHYSSEDSQLIIDACRFARLKTAIIPTDLQAGISDICIEPPIETNRTTAAAQPILIPHNKLCYNSEHKAIAQSTELPKFKDDVYQEVTTGLPKQIADQFTCPITKKVMRQPVTASDGHTYERAAILKYMVNDDNDISPVTGVPFTNMALRRNYNLQALIEDLLDTDVTDGGETEKTKEKTTEEAPKPKPKKRKPEPETDRLKKKNKTNLTNPTKTKPGPKKGQTNAYQQFAIIQRQRIKQTRPNATLAELSKQIAQEWKAASTAVKEQFKQTATSINNNGP